MCWRSAADRTAPRSLGRTRRGVRGLAEDRRPLPAVLNGNRRLDLRDQSAQLLDLTRAEPGGIVHSRRLTYGTFECGNPILAVSGPSPIATRRRRKSSIQAVNKPPCIGLYVSSWRSLLAIRRPAKVVCGPCWPVVDASVSVPSWSRPSTT